MGTYVDAVYNQDTCTTQRLQQDLAPTPLQKIRAALTSIVRRCTKEGSAIILPRGGGDASSIDRATIPAIQDHIEQLSVAIDEAHARKRTVHKRKLQEEDRRLQDDVSAT